jgi:hypothetical protein
MNNLGPRLCGSPAHRTFTNSLADQFGAGLQNITRDRHPLPRWDARRWELKLHTGTGTESLPVSSYCAYSGKTGPEGVTGEVVFCGPLTPRTHIPTNLDLNGKIAFFTATTQPQLLSEWFAGHIRDVYNSEGDTTFPYSQDRAAFAIALMPATLHDELKNAGAVGALFGWTNVADENAADQYLYTYANKDVPTLYISSRACSKLLDLAGGGLMPTNPESMPTKVTLILEAEIFPNDYSETVIGSLPGRNADESIIVWSHTDGMNAIEENGAIAVLAMAKYFSRLPAEKRDRNLIFVLSEGHFSGGYVSMGQFLTEHPDIKKKAVAAIGIEHLGTREWLNDFDTNTYKPSGRPELGFAWARPSLWRI